MCRDLLQFTSVIQITAHVSEEFCAGRGLLQLERDFALKCSKQKCNVL